jgi:nucleotide sugar dehydrogenase
MMDVDSARYQLRTGQKKIAVWGLGYIGYSSMAHFARSGVNTIGTDIDPLRVRDVNTPGNEILPNLGGWLGFDTRSLVERGLIRATNDWHDLIKDDVILHLVAVPTERSGNPWSEALCDVLRKLFSTWTTTYSASSSSAPLIVIESTVTTRDFSSVIMPLACSSGVELGRDFLLSVAPRRDWFAGPERTLRTLPRIVGGTDGRTTALTCQILGLVSDNILPATDHLHACTVKAVENAYRHLDITLANQLSLAYPELDMTEVLRLAGTKWNVETYRPSIGTGGYCIPLAPKYVLEGATHPEALSLLRQSLTTDAEQPHRVADAIARRKVGSVGLLGLAYAPNLKVHALSPSLTLIKAFDAYGIQVKVHDPLYSDEEIRVICGAEPFAFPGGLQEFDAVVLVTGHLEYQSTVYADILSKLRSPCVIVDNVGAWRDFPFAAHGIEYVEAGSAHWLG